MSDLVAPALIFCHLANSDNRNIISIYQLKHLNKKLLQSTLTHLSPFLFNSLPPAPFNSLTHLRHLTGWGGADPLRCLQTCPDLTKAGQRARCELARAAGGRDSHGRPPGNAGPPPPPPPPLCTRCVRRRRRHQLLIISGVTTHLATCPGRGREEQGWAGL